MNPFIAIVLAAFCAAAGAQDRSADYEKVALDADVLFESGSSALSAAGRATLNDFVARMHGLESQTVLAIGYAGRIGAESPDRALSDKRLGVVKAYLVGKGIASGRVHTSAREKIQADTRAGECRDAGNARNVACLQPDRRVFIEISGTRIARQ